MYHHLVRWLVAVIVITSCKPHEPKRDAAPAPVVVLRDAAIDAAPPDASASKSCVSMDDCAKIPDNWKLLSCQYDCDTQHGRAPGHCVLEEVSDKVGAGPCFGNRRNLETIMSYSKKPPLMVVCDVDAGVYCSGAVCGATLPLGAACDGDAACGKDGVCTDNKCARAPGPGAKCVHGWCNSSAYCDDDGKRCHPLHPEGARCNVPSECESKECRSINGAPAHCVAELPTLPCPWL